MSITALSSKFSKFYYSSNVSGLRILTYPCLVDNIISFLSKELKRWVTDFVSLS